MQAELTVLGCGDSQGTPRIGNNWGECDPNEPKNIRTRPSICVKTNNTTLIVDSGPDFKQQLNRENISRIDAIIYTHAHSDHVNGIDDIKGFYDRDKKRIPIYLTEEAFAEIKNRFTYIFEQQSPLYPVIADVHLWQQSDFGQKKKISEIEFTPFLQDHGGMHSVGYRFGDLAYSTDLVNLDDEAIKTIEGIKTWIVDGADLFHERPLVHMSLKKMLELNERIGAEKIYLVHIKYIHDYQTLLKKLPEHVRPAFDGMKLTVNL